MHKERDVGVLSGQLARQISGLLLQKLQPLGLTPAQFQLLSELWARDGVTQRELTLQMGVEQASMANMLMRMEREGLVVRTPNPKDARSHLIYLTDQARGVEEEAKLAALETNQLVLEGLPLAERDLFLSMLGRILSALRATNAQSQQN